MLTVNLFSVPATGFAVIFGVENISSLTFSVFSPVIVTSTFVPTCPPMGMTVSRRGSGKVTCWARAETASSVQTASVSVDFASIDQ